MRYILENMSPSIRDELPDKKVPKRMNRSDAHVPEITH